ncbi:COG1361 S-layer family protein [Halobellus inordinatus]|uniref:COG1361 S-layer family protein n=1 Tax=Halobellus inordinatus TaxID=1126236 RepID=UPI00210E1A95|nr:COG1361 S-layer family protein [Halobellus inordinatus]
MKRKLCTALIVASLLASAVPAVALTSNPNIQTVTPDPSLQPGGVNELAFQLVNDGEGAEDGTRAAHNVHIRPRDAGPIEVETEQLYVEQLPDGTPAELSLKLNVPSNVNSGTYRIPLRLSYEYDNGAGNDVERETTIYLPVRVESGPRFDVVDTASTATVSGQGTLEVTVKNVGDDAAYDSELTLSSSAPDVSVGSNKSSTQFVDVWERNENRTFEFDIGLRDSASAGSYALSSQIDFEKSDGTTGSTPSLTVPLRAHSEMTFEISNLNSSLRVSEEGAVTGTITNTGPMPADNAVVTLQDPGPTITPVEDSVAVGSLDPGESAAFSFEVEVASSASAVPQQFDFGVSYRDQDDTARQAEAVPKRVMISEQSPEFDVEPVNGTFGAGSGGEFEVTVTNTRDYAVSDVSAKIYMNSPLSSSDDEAFIGRLEPGESETMVFQLSADGDATAKTYPVKMDFQYDDEDGDTIISDTYQVPVEVMSSSGGGPPIVPIAGVVIVLVVAGGGLYYRRRG